MSHSFADCAGRVWPVSVTIATVKRVRSLCGFDLMGLDAKGIHALASNPVLLVDVVYAVCKPQADALGITDEAFGESMAGDAIDGATKALLGAIVDFSPSPADRANLRKVLAGLTETEREMREMVATRLPAAMEAAKASALRDFGDRLSSLPGASE